MVLLDEDTSTLTFLSRTEWKMPIIHAFFVTFPNIDKFWTDRVVSVLPLKSIPSRTNTTFHTFWPFSSLLNRIFTNTTEVTTYILTLQGINALPTFMRHIIIPPMAVFQTIFRTKGIYRTLSIIQIFAMTVLLPIPFFLFPLNVPCPINFYFLYLYWLVNQYKYRKKSKITKN